jgi:hypothetical protein
MCFKPIVGGYTPPPLPAPTENEYAGLLSKMGFEALGEGRNQKKFTHITEKLGYAPDLAAMDKKWGAIPLSRRVNWLRTNIEKTSFKPEQDAFPLRLARSIQGLVDCKESALLNEMEGHMRAFYTGEQVSVCARAIIQEYATSSHVTILQDLNPLFHFHHHTSALDHLLAGQYEVFQMLALNQLAEEVISDEGIQTVHEEPIDISLLEQMLEVHIFDVSKIHFALDYLEGVLDWMVFSRVIGHLLAHAIKANSSTIYDLLRYTSVYRFPYIIDRLLDHKVSPQQFFHLPIDYSKRDSRGGNILHHLAYQGNCRVIQWAMELLAPRQLFELSQQAGSLFEMSHSALPLDIALGRQNYDCLEHLNVDPNEISGRSLSRSSAETRRLSPAVIPNELETASKKRRVSSIGSD